MFLYHNKKRLSVVQYAKKHFRFPYYFISFFLRCNQPSSVLRSLLFKEVFLFWAMGEAMVDKSVRRLFSQCFLSLGSFHATRPFIILAVLRLIV